MWRVAYEPDRRLLTISLHEVINPKDVRDVGGAQAEALACTAGSEFLALLDLRQLFPLEEETALLLATLKEAIAEHPGFRGMLILTDSPTVAMQQHHTRVRSGAARREELITMDVAEVQRFLARAP